MKIGTREVGPEQPVCIVAEMSANHNGDIAKAKELIDAAQWAGADLVKMQIYTADEMCLPGVKCPVPGPWEGQDLHELYQRAGTPWEWWPVLRDYATSKGVTLFSSAFSLEAVAYLVREGCPAIKVASHEANWAKLYSVPQIEKMWSCDTVCGHQPPIIVSICTRMEYESASSADAILWCPGGYPAGRLDPSDVAWLDGRQKERHHRRLIGLSDNGGPDTRAKSWSDAIRAGASMIEAHIKLNGARTEDDAFSMSPEEMQHMIAFARECLRRPPDTPSPYRRSVWLTKPVRQGESVLEHVRMLRPFGHIEPSHWPYGNGHHSGSAARDLEPGPLRWEDVE